MPEKNKIVQRTVSKEKTALKILMMEYNRCLKSGNTILHERKT